MPGVGVEEHVDEPLGRGGEGWLVCVDVRTHSPYE